MKVWEKAAQAHKKSLLAKAESIYDVWRKFAEDGDCEFLPIGCENCPFCKGACLDLSMKDRHEILNKEAIND